jgi:hypothetical protein
MKNFFYLSGALLVLHGLLPSQAIAQISNGDFETQFASNPPSRELNIKGDHSYYLNQLPNWSVPSSATGVESINASFLATNGASNVNPSIGPCNTCTPSTFNGPFSPHNNSIGCVGIKRDPGNTLFDGLITQKTTSPLLAGHTYHYSYYVLRRPAGSYKCKMAFNIVNSTSTPAFNASPSINALVPSPVITNSSDYIVGDQWIKVEGDFQLAQSLNDAWVVVGYDRAPEVSDPSLPNISSGTEQISYVLDDISLIDMGCAIVQNPQALTPEWNCVDGPGPIWGYIENYNPAFTYTITTTGGIYNSPPNAFVQNYDKDGVLKWGYRLRAPQTGTTGTVTINVTNTCGSTGSTTYGITSPSANCENYRAEATSAYPNPATDQLQVPASTERAVLLNGAGKQVQAADASGKLDVQAVPDGLYNLQLLHKGKLTNQRIQIKH